MDTIGEFITRIRNASASKQEKFDVPSSNLRVKIAEVLRDEGYIRNFKVVRDDRQGMMRVYLKYNEKGEPQIQMLKRSSRPGRRYYVGKEDIPDVQSGFGVAILSTNKGIMSNREARKQNVGGELLLKVW